MNEINCVKRKLVILNSSNIIIREKNFTYLEDNEKYERTKLTAIIDDIEKENYKHSNLIMETADLMENWEKLTKLEEQTARFVVVEKTKISASWTKNYIFKELKTNFYFISQC